MEGERPQASGDTRDPDTNNDRRAAMRLPEVTAPEAASEERRPLEALVSELASLPRKQRTLLVGIDGLGGSGKSTLANALRDVAPQLIRIVRMDDFFRQWADRAGSRREEVGTPFDWQRLWDQVLVPLSRDEPARYQRYDWPTNRLADWFTTPVGGIAIIEGVYALRAELRRFYDFKIWVECSSDVRLARGLARDGEQARDVWVNEWMPAEDRYAEVQRPLAHAELVVDGCPHPPSDPAREYVTISQARFRTLAG